MNWSNPYHMHATFLVFGGLALGLAVIPDRGIELKHMRNKINKI